MKLTESFFKAIYGYELTYPGFAETALKKFDDMGSKTARSYYEQFSKKYEDERKYTLRNVGVWYVEQLERKWEEKEREEVIAWTKDPEKMSNQELMRSLELLAKEV